MLGIVFCGGKSSRMGTDKGLISLLDKNWATIAAEKLSTLNIPVRLSINPRQKNSYEQFFAEELLLLDDESLGIGGPLLGLLSAHLLHPSEDLFILACDLPLMKNSLLKSLYAIEQDNSEYEVFVFTIHGAAEPLCAIYKSNGLRKVVKKLSTNELIKYSMKSVLSVLKVLELEVAEEDREAFRNFNTHGLM
jgi:molybdopterin-guanine dinucleotide biosynthesis protein A